MINNITFLERKKMCVCILAGLCAAALFVIINSGEKIIESKNSSFVIKIKHYGIDAAEMERSVTIPLEDALYSISGIQSIQSISENSNSSVYIRFKNEKFKTVKGRYEAVRDAAQRIYETLPSSAQRPEIFNSNNSRIPVWSAAVLNDDTLNESNDTAGILEKILKPRLEGLEGAAEVLVYGIGIKEIFITFDQEKLSILGLEPSAAASFLAMNDSIFSGGRFIQGNKEIIITVDGVYHSFEDALIPLNNGIFIKLSDIAQISEQEREPDIISRLNGKKTASIAIMGQHDANLRKLSSQIKKELDFLSASELKNYKYIVLSDIGAEEAAAFNSVLNAAVLGAIMTAVISFLLNRNKKFIIGGFFCSASIPVICLISAAILSVFGFAPDRLLLAGIAAGVGTAIDAVILCSERLRKCKDYRSASVFLSTLKAPLIAGGGTTIAALIPLFFIDDEGARIIACAVAVVTFTALFLSLTILPPLLLWGLKNEKENKINDIPKKLTLTARKISRNINRFFAALIRACVNFPIIVISVSIFLIISAVFLLIVKGVDTDSIGSEDSVYGQIEFDGGLLAEEIDRLLTEYSDRLLKIPGIKNIETGSRTGSGSLMISFFPNQTKAHLVKETAKNINIPGSFVYFHDNSIKDRYWEIFVYGDEDRKCREIAKELALICAESPVIKERILNFKQGRKKMVMLPDREILAGLSTSFSTAADRLRMGVYGPVIYKRMESGGEIDVRVRTGFNVTRQSKEDVLKTLVSTGDSEKISSLPINSLMKIKDDFESSGIRRENRRRSASITISSKPADPRRIKNEIDRLTKKLDLSSGYSIEFDPEAIKQSENLSATVFSLLGAIIFCYMIIAAVNESFKIPFMILSVIPASLAIPAISLVLSGGSYNSAVACAFIAVSGMTVNAAILCAEGVSARTASKNRISSLSIYLGIRKKLPALLSTTGTTIAGALPFLFLTEGVNSLIRTLSFVGALGVTCSSLCSVTILPSLLSVTNKLFKNIFFN